MSGGRVRASRDGRLGHLVLDRPEAINALTHDMVVELRAALEEWRADPGVGAVVLTGAGDRGLCAGGDVLAMRADALSGGRSILDFWYDEYLLDLVVATYPKPVVAVMDGIVLGGGVGLSGHASCRIVTERSRVGMPETRIGFFPDVGGTWLLSRTPGPIGMHVALTGAHLGAADAIAVGLADRLVPTDRLGELLDRLTGRPVGEAVGALGVAPGAPRLPVDEPWLQDCYRPARDAADLLTRLRDHGAEAAAETAEVLESRSPTSVAVTFRAVAEARELPDLATALVHEFRIASRFLDAPDLPEGIRATVVDRDAPHWAPAHVRDLDEAAVQRFFEPLPTGCELDVASLAPRRRWLRRSPPAVVEEVAPSVVEEVAQRPSRNHHTVTSAD